MRLALPIAVLCLATAAEAASSDATLKSLTFQRRRRRDSQQEADHPHNSFQQVQSMLGFDEYEELEVALQHNGNPLVNSGMRQAGSTAAHLRHNQVAPHGDVAHTYQVNHHRAVRSAVRCVTAATDGDLHSRLTARITGFLEDPRNLHG